MVAYADGSESDCFALTNVFVRIMFWPDQAISFFLHWEIVKFFETFVKNLPPMYPTHDLRPLFAWHYANSYIKKYSCWRADKLALECKVRDNFGKQIMLMNSMKVVMITHILLHIWKINIYLFYFIFLCNNLGKMLPSIVVNPQKVP